MDEFERAKLKAAKKREQNERYREPVVVKKEEPKVERKPQPMMTVVISGPANLCFSIDYAGTLTSGQANPEALMSAFKKQLSVFGKVL